MGLALALVRGAYREGLVFDAYDETPRTPRLRRGVPCPSLATALRS